MNAREPLLGMRNPPLYRLQRLFLISPQPYRLPSPGKLYIEPCSYAQIGSNAVSTDSSGQVWERSYSSPLGKWAL
jgi:hypothetical protein